MEKQTERGTGVCSGVPAVYVSGDGGSTESSIGALPVGSS